MYMYIFVRIYPKLCVSQFPAFLFSVAFIWLEEKVKQHLKKKKEGSFLGVRVEVK